MKVCLIHNYYTQAGGEDGVLSAEIKLLSENSVENIAITKKSSALSKLQLGTNFFMNSVYSEKSKKEIKQKLILEKPDVVHVHNFYSLFTPSIYDACQELKIPVVQTLHNFRIIYPNALLYNNGQVDLRTITGSAWQVVKDKVYHDSYIKTAVMARFIEYHKKRNTWNTKVDKFIALTEFSKNVFVQFGIESDKIIVKPNFQFQSTENIDSANQVELPREDFVLFVGRISEEKGIVQLVKEWIEKKSSVKLKIAGEGPLFKELQDIVNSSGINSIEILGNQPKEEIKKLMNQAKALVFPSLWYEGFPMVLVEALSNGLPVITTNIGSQASIIKDQFTGYHVSVDSLSKMIEQASVIINDDDAFTRLCENAKNEFIEKYTDKVNFNQLMSIYKEVIELKKKNAQ